MFLYLAAAEAAAASANSLCSLVASLHHVATATMQFFLPLPSPSKDEDDALICKAISLIERRCFSSSIKLDNPRVVTEFLQLKLSAEPREVFAVMFLNAQNRLIAYEPMFFGSLTQTSVYPRAILQEALKLNAAAVIVAHNHPSGDTKPSSADDLLTETLRSTLQLAEVKVLDHFIVGEGRPFSYAESGRL